MQTPFKKSRRFAAWFFTLLFLSLVTVSAGHHHAAAPLNAVATSFSGASAIGGSDSELSAAPLQAAAPFDCPVCHWLAEPFLSPSSGVTLERGPAGEPLPAVLPYGDAPVFVRFSARPGGSRAPPSTLSS